MQPDPITEESLTQLEESIGLNFAGGNISEIITALLPYIFAGAGILLLLFLLYGGISLMTAGGDPKAVQSARSKITGALIGFVIVFISFWLVQLIGGLLGLEVFGEIF